ncbi:MAG TPA: GAF domain-containing protein [Thermoanaerobaculia bacterium]|nr:GAF domain-containing protein [Thermoanaerobaculia bacterium]
MSERNTHELLQENQKLRELAARLEAERIELEEQNTNLANLYVASYRLHSTLDRAEVLAGIQEIIINLVGSEELTVWELDHEVPRLAAAVGVEAERFDELPEDARRRIDECMRSRQLWVRDGGAVAAEPLTACIPMIVDDRPTGAIAIFRLLQQKSGLDAVDRELFGLLATHAATALYCANLHATGTAVM